MLPLLPRPLTSFVGRSAELDATAAAVRQHPLVTIVGPPGVGKTRLAIEVAHRLTANFGKNVLFIDLTPIVFAELVPGAVLDAMGITARGRAATQALARHLGDTPTLLVLDNCEHLADAVAEFALGMLAACPRLRLLSTSRVELGVAGERVLPLAPMLDASLGQPNDDALHLFLDRAAAVGAAVDGAADRPAVERICARLDGLPLAIELAAARTRFLALDELEAALVRPLQALASAPPRSAPPQKPLLESVAWSYRLCTAEERTAWELLSVFPGSFGLPAAAAVLRSAGLDQPLAVVEALVTRSILLTVTGHGSTRYRMLFVLREFGCDKLRQRDAEVDARRAHAAWYADVAAELELAWVGPGQAGRLQRVVAELANIREAADFALQSGDHDLVHKLVALPAAELWWATGRLEEGMLWLRRAIRATSDPSPVRFHMLVMAGTFTLALGLADEAAGYAAELRDAAGSAPTPFRVGASAFVDGFQAITQGDYPAAIEILRAGIRAVDGTAELARAQLRNRQMLTFALNALRRDQEAAAICDEITEIAAAAGDAYYGAFANQMQALYAWRSGHSGVAASRAEAALRTSLDFPDRPENGDLLLISALIEARWGDTAKAAALAAAANATDRIGLRPATLEAPDVAATARRLGELSEHATARALGASLTARQAIELALGTRALPSTDHSALTAREDRIARLIASGMANKQIASELGIAPKTVEGHITRLMAKLGLRSRVQVATWVARHEPDPPPGRAKERLGTRAR